MKTFSSIWTDNLRDEIAKDARRHGYSMSLVGEDRQNPHLSGQSQLPAGRFLLAIFIAATVT